MTIAEERFNNLLKFIEHQNKEIQTLREALEFYADKEKYELGVAFVECSCPVMDDEGAIARKALGIEK